jgi:glycosyltransferase involved in cell wall biosynthesis
MKKVSVVLTTYNSQRYLNRTIESILNQNGRGINFDLELIVIDDCSTDNTVDIILGYDLKNLSTGRNSGGPNKGRNIGLRKATGDYICIVDHDDEWKPERISTLLPFLEQVPIVTSGYTSVNMDSGLKYDVACSEPSGYVFYGRNMTFLQKLQKSSSGQNAYLGSIIFHSSLKNILFEENFGVVDYDWILRLFHEKESIEVCRSLYFRHIRKCNLSFNEDYRRKDYYYSLMFLENYENDYPDEVSVARMKINGTRARYYYLMNNMKKARYYFRRARFNFRNIAYYLSTYMGSGLVRKRFKILR